MRVRLFHEGTRLVFVRRDGPGRARWSCPHLTTPDWAAILSRQLRLLNVRFEHAGPSRLILEPGGQIEWRSRRWWSIITLRLDAGSDARRQLVGAALLRSARYARPVT